MMAHENVGAVLTDLKVRVAGLVAALISRDGQIVSADFPEGTPAETFAIMCATVLGAAGTAITELERPRPERITIEGADSKTVIMGVGVGALLVVVAESSSDSRTLLDEVAKFADLLAKGESFGTVIRDTARAKDDSYQ